MDNLNWEVTDYKTKDGISHVERFLNSLPAKVAKKVNDDINLLERFGPRWGHPHIDYFKNEKIYELRVKHSSTEFSFSIGKELSCC